MDVRRLLAAALLLLSGVAHGAEIVVPTDQATIEAAVASASAGDTVTILAGTYTESVEVSGSDLTIRGATGDADDVIWKPDGTTDDVDNFCLFYNWPHSGTLTIRDVTFAGDAGANHVGIDWPTSDDDLVLAGVKFRDLRASVFRAAGGTAYLEMRNVSLSSPQATKADDGFSQFRFANLDSALVEGCTFDLTGVGTTGWSSFLRVESVSNVTIRDSAFTARFLGDDIVNGFVYLNGSVSNVLIEGCTFRGNDVAYRHIGLGDVAASDQVTGLTVRGCTFSEMGVAIDIRNPEATAAGQLHRNVVVYGCDFYSTGGAQVSDSQFGIKADGLNGGSFIGNRFYDFERFGGVTLTTGRNVVVSGNEFYNCDNGISVAGTNVLDAGNSYAVSIVGNYFERGAADGAIKIDNYDEGDTAAAPNDSSLSIGGNVFSNVADVGDWVDTSNVQDSFTTVAGWVAEMQAESSLMILQGEGSVMLPDGITAARAAGILPGGSGNVIGVTGAGIE